MNVGVESMCEIMEVESHGLWRRVELLGSGHKLVRL